MQTLHIIGLAAVNRRYAVHRMAYIIDYFVYLILLQIVSFLRNKT